MSGIGGMSSIRVLSEMQNDTGSIQWRVEKFFLNNTHRVNYHFTMEKTKKADNTTVLPLCTVKDLIHNTSLFVRLVVDGWCRFVPRKNYC
jgi:hypothetical protein